MGRSSPLLYRKQWDGVAEGWVSLECISTSRATRRPGNVSVLSFKSYPNVVTQYLVVEEH